MILLNGNPINITKFPDNTSQVWKLPEEILKETDYARITWNFNNEGEFLQLAQLKALIDIYGLGADLILTYLPYGRQDKDIDNEQTFALHPFANLLNSLNFLSVVINDPHSETAIELIKNSKAVYPTDQLAGTLRLLGGSLVFCYPDQGARDKYYKIYGPSHLWGDKVRNQKTGRITEYELHGNPHRRKVLIIDDIADGGMTFVLLTRELLKRGAKEVNLFVSHGIFSKGLKPLKDAGIKRIFTKDGEATEVQKHITYRRIQDVTDTDSAVRFL